jgi:hypothetical protein
MRVRELIEELQKRDAELEILVVDTYLGENYRIEIEPEELGPYRKQTEFLTVAIS